MAEHYGSDPDTSPPHATTLDHLVAVAADERQRATIERVLGLHVDRCPVARTIGGCVAISTGLDLQTVDEPS